MTHDEEMWQDYDYHQNTGELPEYFDEEGDEYCDDDGDYGEGSGPDYIPVHRRCPRCGSWSAMLLEDGTFSCLYCSAHFFNDRIIKDVEVTDEADEIEDENDGLGVPLYCIKCGSGNTEYYDNNTFHCLDCDCVTHPGARCPKCRRHYMSLQPDNTWICLSCGAKITDEETVDDIHFKCHVYNVGHLADLNQEALIKKYSKKANLEKKPKKRK